VFLWVFDSSVNPTPSAATISTKTPLSGVHFNTYGAIGIGMEGLF